MITYEEKARIELKLWKRELKKQPSFINNTAKNIQYKINNLYPEKYHKSITNAIKGLTKSVLYSSKYIGMKPVRLLSFQQRESLILKKSKTYRKIASVEGAATGAGGIMIGLADFPLLLSIKFKLLFDIASIYGFNVKEYKERLYILYVFQLAFSSKQHVNKIIYRMEHWDEYCSTLPDDFDNFDWRTFQQEYRDYIDLAKLLQLLPGIGLLVGSYVNNKLVDRLTQTAIMAYRMRLLAK